MVSDDRGAVYTEGDKVIYRASSLGHCIRALVAERRGLHGAPKEEWVHTVMQEGNLHEPDIMARVAATGKFHLLDKAQEEIELEIPATCAVVRGHLDGICLDSHGRSVVVEAKSMSDAAFKRWRKNRFEEYPAYAWQSSVYAYGTGAEQILMACKNRNNGELDLWLTRPEISLEQIIERIQQIEDWAYSSTSYPPCEPGEQWRCGFYFLHDDAPPQPTNVEYTHLHDGRLDALLTEYKRVAVQEDVDRSRKEELRQEILAMLGDVNKVETKHFKVQVKTTTTTRLDIRKVRSMLNEDQIRKASVASESNFLLVDPT